MQRKKLEFKCDHPGEPVIRVIGGNCNCEITVLACPICGEYLEEPKIDC